MEPLGLQLVPMWDACDAGDRLAQEATAPAPPVSVLSLHLCYAGLELCHLPPSLTLFTCEVRTVSASRVVAMGVEWVARWVTSAPSEWWLCSCPSFPSTLLFSVAAFALSSAAVV